MKFQNILMARCRKMAKNKRTAENVKLMWTHVAQFWRHEQKIHFLTLNPITGGVSEHPITGGVMQFCITLDISTTTNARTLKLGQDMH